MFTVSAPPSPYTPSEDHPLARARAGTAAGAAVNVRKDYPGSGGVSGIGTWA